MEPLTRREFLEAAAQAVLAGGALGRERQDDPRGAAAPPRAGLLDIHVHLFGTGDSGSGCRLSKKVTRGVQFLGLRWLLGIDRRSDSLDQAYEEALAEAVEGSGLDAAVILAQDGVYDARGLLDDARTHVYVPNDYLFQIARRHPGMVPCVSINPDRRDALDELERCAAQGARVLKIHPPIQGVDVSDPKHRKFFERCTALGCIVMVHTGAEHSAPVIDPALADPLLLEPALDRGCTVVACHSGTGSPIDRADHLPRFLQLARKYENLWGDTAVLGSIARVQDFLRLLEARDVLPRLLHGSDFPFPPAPLAFARRIGLRRALALAGEENFLRKDLELKEALGIGRESAERAHRLVFGKKDRRI